MNIVAHMDHLLREREQVARDLTSEDRVRPVTLACTGVFLVLTFAYGLIMGSQSLIRGSAEGWKYALAAGVKLPFLFLLTLAICLPLLYVLNVLIGPRAKFSAILGVLMASIAVTSIVLGACAPIVLFFMLSTPSYPFVKLLNVAVFALAGAYGVWFLSRAIGQLVQAPGGAVEGAPAGVQTIIKWWLITYGVVGTQMAWILRPFLGNPGQPFSFFRALESNFYVDVLKTIGRFFAD
jgi:hypothetical protein